MSIKLTLNGDKLGSEKCAQMHLLPFRVDHDGPANVSKYFTPYIKKFGSTEDQEASFRGYPLKGKSIALPEGFKGLIFTETNPNHLDEHEERNFFLKDKFTEITYWNYDKLSSCNDAILSTMDWIDISNAIHSEED